LEPEKAHFTGEFVIVAKFGDHVLHRLASCLSNAIRQVDKQAKIPLQVTLLRIQCLAFDNYLVVLNAIFGFGSARTIL